MRPRFTPAQTRPFELLPDDEWAFYYACLEPGAKAFSPVRNINKKPSEGFSLAADDKDGDGQGDQRKAGAGAVWARVDTAPGMARMHPGTHRLHVYSLGFGAVRK